MSCRGYARSCVPSMMVVWASEEGGWERDVMEVCLDTGRRNWIEWMMMGSFSGLRVLGFSNTFAAAKDL